MGPSGLRSGRPAAAGSADQKLALPPGLAQPPAALASAVDDAPRKPLFVRARRKKPGDDESGTTCGSSQMEETRGPGGRKPTSPSGSLITQFLNQFNQMSSYGYGGFSIVSGGS